MRPLLVGLVLAVAQGGAPAQDATAPPAAAPRTNIVLLLSDDAGFADFGFQADCAADARGRRGTSARSLANPRAARGFK